VIGKLVAHCIKEGRTLPEIELETYRTFSPVFGPDVYDVLDVRRALDARKAVGAPSLENVRAQLERWRGALGG
jgi:argininosuccinate lyase